MEKMEKRLNIVMNGIKKGAIENLCGDDIFINVVFVLGIESYLAIPFEFKNVQEKKEMVAAICAIAEKENPIGIFMVHDMWMTQRKVVPGETIDINKVPLPSESPDRKQAICIMGAGHFFKKCFLIPYTRENGKVILGDEVEVSDFEDFNFSSVFKDKKYDA